MSERSRKIERTCYAFHTSLTGQLLSLECSKGFQGVCRVATFPSHRYCGLDHRRSCALDPCCEHGSSRVHRRSRQPAPGGDEKRVPRANPQGLRELLREDFDVPALGRFVLGCFWRIFTPSEKQEFLELFENYVVFTYGEKLIEYCNGGTSLRVTGSRPDPDGVIVISELVRGSGAGAGKRDPSAQPIRVDWRLSTLNGGYRITDIIIDGLSMAANGRSRLEGVVQRNGGRAQAILAVMRQQTTSASAR